MATEHDHRPIWALSQPADRKPRYTREQIADAALRIADAGGFDAVTMKRIAAQLGAATMTLYYYVRNKTDIVALMQRAGERRPRDRRELRDQSLAGDLVFSVGQLVLGHYPIDVFAFMSPRTIQ